MTKDNTDKKQKLSKEETAEKKRQRSTEKEKRRNVDINRAFDVLQNKLPSCVPKNNRLPKIKTLRLALRYLEHLQEILHGKTVVHEFMATPRPLAIEDFATVAMTEIQNRNSYSDRIRQDIAAKRAHDAHQEAAKLSSGNFASSTMQMKNIEPIELPDFSLLPSNPVMYPVQNCAQNWATFNSPFCSGSVKFDY